MNKMSFSLSFEYPMWMNEVCMMLTERFINEWANDSLGYHKVVGSELETVD